MPDWIEAVKFHSAVHSASNGQPRYAIVTSVDPANHAIKARIEPDGVETGWIPDSAVAAGGLKIACPSEVGTQVLLLAVEGDTEHPVVVGRLFDTVSAPPVSPATSQPVQPGEVGVFLQGGVYLHLTPAGVFIAGDVRIAGTVTSTGDVVAGEISLQLHVHGAVQAGQGRSGPPSF
ncbi:phage baseplate assembly protein V [Lichenicoccus roseus]|uniref:phage baseplate assembly protein V n=1 Tax=Lichenicoccus roseus TaxID=2683649 RepID=UPI001F1124CA|nr:phage baseplate assembly protein V [Lichenicoccus roseus]